MSNLVYKFKLAFNWNLMFSKKIISKFIVKNSYLIQRVFLSFNMISLIKDKE